MLDFLPDNQTLSLWLTQYGSFALFGLLLLGIVAFPVPEETLMVIAGFLMSQGKLAIPSTMLAAYLGSICGITISYTLGRAFGKYLLVNYGSWIGITEARLTKTHNWFERYGKWTLVIGYYIPGVRHFTGFLAGSAYLEIHEFVRFAYFGAIIWVSTFLSLGYFLGDYCLTVGNYCMTFFEELEFKADWFSIAIIIIAIFYIAYKVRRHH